MINLPTKFEVSTFSRYGDMKCVKNAQNGGGLGWLGVTQGHRKCRHSIRMRLPHTTSYSTLIETMRLSCTVFETQRIICRNSPTSTYPTCIWRPRWGDPVRIWKQFLASENQSPWAIVWRCLRDPVNSRFGTIPMRDRHTQTKTHRHTVMAYTAQSKAHAVKLSFATCFTAVNILR